MQNIFIIIMQEAYFKSRNLNYHKELLGLEDSKDGETTVKKTEVDHSPKKITKSKQTLIKILEEDRGSSTSSRRDSPMSM